MKRAKFETWATPTWLRLVQLMIALGFLYLLFMSFEIPLVLLDESGPVPEDGVLEVPGESLPRLVALQRRRRVQRASEGSPLYRTPERRMRELRKVSGLVFNESLFDSNAGRGELSELQKATKHAWVLGKKLWDELQSGKLKLDRKTKQENVSESCPHSISLSGSEFYDRRNRLLVIPCGLTLWSHITVVGTPRWAHQEYDPKISVLKEGDGAKMVSQFMIELQGLKAVDGEDPPKILHFNPRLKGDWSGKPAIELNTCYRMQWGWSMRCGGWKSRADEETVDGQVKCENWIRDDNSLSEESKTTWWLKRLIGRKTKVSVDWPYPFAEGKLFVLTLSAGLEGYHVHVDGRHVTSFPYRTGFVLEEATGLSVYGDIDVHSIIAGSLPTSHPSFRPQMHLEMVARWKAPPPPYEHVELFVGILSAGNHFAERMAVRKSWMQHKLIKSSNVVARFFVALHGRKEIDLELKKEAEYFGDIVIVPYLDNYDLVVLKTVAICEYGVRSVAAKYIMKCDDDTFVRVDAVIMEAGKVDGDRSLYIGNMNYHHKPLRNGKWAVTYEEWPEEDYPPYANGPGYILSSDIARFIVSEFEKHKLRLFKMEDVSMGMWVEQFNGSKTVQYMHSLKFCQYGCVEDYFTAHYQSPRQMICMWDKLHHQGKPRCCNLR